jgi:oxygen-independent coproporphyrinogen-3 oxidase
MKAERDAASGASRRREPRAGSLYLHVPFCARICDYCHFARTDRHDPGLRREVVRAMVRERELRSAACTVLREGRWRLASVYVGGGTPSVLEPELLATLLAGTLAPWPRPASVEVTAEANPESLDEAVLAAWRDLGVNRISLGVQSLAPAVLRQLGRGCDAATARAALRRVCAAFPRVAADWILAPGVRRAVLLAELTEAVALGVEHVSLYILEVHPGTPLARRVADGRVRLPADAEFEELYLAAAARLEKLGLHQYEVASFARPGRESRHNSGYWTGRPYLGLGPGAHGFYGRRRYANAATLATYLAAIARGELPEEVVDSLDPAARRLEGLILPLRTSRGVALAALPAGALDLERGAAEGLWRIGAGRLRLTPRGFLRLDSVEEALARALRPAARPATGARGSG